ncbi:TonB-dependent receptor plug domain-containing protein [Sphingosinicella sp.]|uniref:TonB-dependent receptor plug domain-containing protein n=1 Tax=Sphingosinicella sp. TaxID=1917971 RepID=UPI004037D881
MTLSLLLLGLAAQADADQSIVVTAARTPVGQEEAPASTTLFDARVLDALSLPAAADVLRLSPGLTVATTGPRGTQTQVRIRGAEASHTLVYLDGIRFNDPAAGNEARFELLTTDSLSRLEIVRGPQSALWGSEALGGVIAAETADPFTARGFEGLGEYGSLDSLRLFGRGALTAGDVGISAAAGWQNSDGIDSFGAGGERDGFDNRFASLRIEARPSAAIRLGAVGHYIAGDSDYDGTDPLTFLRADTLDRTENRIAAGRLWFSGDWGDWAARADASYLDSTNRNFLIDAPLNRTSGDRLTLGGQVSRRFGGHQLIAAIEHSQEGFQARDTSFGGFTNQDRSRNLTAFIGEWRAEWSEAIVTDLAVRHDDFSAFADETTFRASVLVRPGGGFTLHAAYGEGIAQPTFFDLFGFFPGSFVGNPNLTPESSRGWEAGLRWSNERWSLSVTGFSHRLRSEIVDVFDPLTFLSSTRNAAGRSRRDGIELAASYRHAEWLTLSANYTWLDADQQTVAGAALVREVRRPRHSANLVAFGESGRFDWSATVAYVGRRRDTDFDLFPAATVTLDDYVLASLRVAWRILPSLELFGRVENGFDADYQDVIGYSTPGRTVHAGLRVSFGN